MSPRQFPMGHQSYSQDHLRHPPRKPLGAMRQAEVRAMIRVFGEVVRAQMRQHGPSARRVRMVNAELERTESSLIIIGGKIVGSLDQDVSEAYRRFSACLRDELAPVLTDLGMQVIGSEPNARDEGTDGCHFLRIAAWRSIDAVRQAPFLNTSTARCCHHRVSGEADTWALPVQVANEVTADLAAVLRQVWDEEQRLASCRTTKTDRPVTGISDVPGGLPARPVQYVNAAMIAAALGVSRPGVRYLSGFPDPAVTLAGPQVSQQGWDRGEIERWASAHGRTVRWPDIHQGTGPADEQLTLWGE